MRFYEILDVTVLIVFFFLSSWYRIHGIRFMLILQ